MRFEFSGSALEQYESLSAVLQKATDKQIAYLINDIRYPSLHAKKYDEATGLWQARINKSWRFYFVIVEDTYYIVSIKRHLK